MSICVWEYVVWIELQEWTLIQRPLREAWPVAMLKGTKAYANLMAGPLRLSGCETRGGAIPETNVGQSLRGEVGRVEQMHAEKGGSKGGSPPRSAHPVCCRTSVHHSGLRCPRLCGPEGKWEVSSRCMLTKQGKASATVGSPGWLPDKRSSQRVAAARQAFITAGRGCQTSVHHSGLSDKRSSQRATFTYWYVGQRGGGKCRVDAC